MKGRGSKYRPDVGEKCLISGPHMDDEKGYVFSEFTVLWKDSDFILYGSPGCYPNLNKWDHIIVKPLNGE